MSRCQACDKQATHHSKHGALRARCCSERCGRELFAGLSVVDDGAIHVAAASPLGRAIAQRTQHRCDHILPASVAAQLIGALQRIGPKRAAADADLPASAQADVPTPIDWIADIPRDVWATAILPYLQRNDLRAFAATSSGSAAAARDERVQAAKYRETHTAYHAALLYMGTSLSPERRRIVRMAFPDAAEMALALLLTVAIEPIYSQNWSNMEYIARVRALRTECGRDGDALYERPILLPGNKIRFSNGMLVPAGSATPVLARAIRYYTKSLRTHSPMSSDRLDTLLHVTKPGTKFPLETPSSPSFFGTIRLTMVNAADYAVHVPNMASFIRRGVDFTRYDAALWLYFFSQFRIPPGLDVPDKLPAFRFDRPRTQPGQFSTLVMGMASLSRYTRIDEMHDLAGALNHEIAQPVKFGDPAGFNILYYPELFVPNAWEIIVQRCYSLQPSMLYDPAPNGQRPFEYYIEKFSSKLVLDWIGSGPTGTPIIKAWRPFAPAIVAGNPAPPRLLAKTLNYQSNLIDEILDFSDTKSIDESHELLEYTQHVALLAEKAYINNDKVGVSRADYILWRIVKALPDNATYAAEYNEIRYDGMDPELRARFAALNPPSM